MGFLFGGNKKVTNTSEPWKPQGQALQTAFNEAQGIYNQQKGTPFFQGSLYAGMDPMTRQAIEGTGAFATGAGQGMADQVSGAASNILGTASPNYLSSIGRYYDMAGADPTGANIAAAGRYADNPYLQSQIDAVGADIRRNLGENIMPSIDRAATATGNINSSRAGIAEGIAARGANEELARAAAGMRFNAYNNGLGLAEQARGTNLNAMGNAAGLYGNATNMGFAAANQGMGMNLQLLDSMVKAGQISQADAQGLLDENFKKWQGQDTRANDLLGRYYSIIGSGNWGGTQTQTQSGGGPGLLGGILGVASTLGGLGWSPFGKKG